MEEQLIVFHLVGVIQGEDLTPTTLDILARTINTYFNQLSKLTLISCQKILKSMTRKE